MIQLIKQHNQSLLCDYLISSSPSSSSFCLICSIMFGKKNSYDFFWRISKRERRARREREKQRALIEADYNGTKV
jgi:hypothetical protein